MVLLKSTILACLLATANAIEFSAWANNGCSGVGYIWRDVKAGSCYTVPAEAKNSAILWAKIPSDWDIRARGFYQNGCTGTVAGSGRSNGQSRMCFNTAQYRAGKFERLNGRRDVDEVDAVEEAGAAPCEKPDQVVLEDGSMFNITGLNEEQFTGMSGASSSEIETYLGAIGI
ncbi:hypothetical protein Micbo1qcDRAFT_178497 [Microdochium bolleyi]|uniref:Uncharacterized protein n=1 Tax=Microdochium bolleyi TaxID=196109 RepID=A0A136ISM0_9PEZI|nr:hypothetical protein Micbo1qcDRAFT_178497 [Microdochium bolleyi]